MTETSNEGNPARHERPQLEHPGPAAVSVPASIVVQRRIEWSDTDASGHYHNTAAFRLAETAETLLFSRLGILREIYGRVPRVRMEADFLRVLRFPDLVEVEFSVAAVGRSSITYDWSIRRQQEICVRGRIVAVLVGEPGGEKATWSSAHRDLLLTAGVQPPELLSQSP